MLRNKKCLAFLMAACISAAPIAAPLPVSASVGIPVAIFNTTVSDNTITAGQNITVRVNTTIAANSVIAAYDNTTAVGTLLSNNGTVKEWTIIIAPAATQTIKLYVGATAEINSLTATFDLPVSVTAAAQQEQQQQQQQQTPAAPVTPSANAGVEITEITETSAGKTVTLTIRTGAAANDVWVRFDGNLYVKGVLGNSDASGKTWTARFNPSAIQTVSVSANSSYNTNGAFSLERTLEFTSSIAPPAAPAIVRASVSRSQIYRNETVDVLIFTNSDTEYAWVEYNNGQRVQASLTSTSGLSKTWTARVSPNATQSIVAFASLTNTNEGAVSSGVSVTLIDDVRNGNRAEISSASATWDDEDDPYRLEVTVNTNQYANYVWIVYDGTTYRLSRTSSGTNRWSMDRVVSAKRNQDDFLLYVSEQSSSTYDDRETVTISNHRNIPSSFWSGGSGSGDDYDIWDWWFEDDNDQDDYDDDNPFGDNESLTIIVETGDNIEKVIVVRDDDRTDEMDYDESPNNRNEFELTLDAPNDGDETVRYRVYAYSDNNDELGDSYEDDITFSIEYEN